MLLNNGSSSSNTVWIEAPVSEVWEYVSTASGWRRFLADISTLSSESNDIMVGETVTLVIGELTNIATCVERKEQSRILFDELYAAILPDGDTWEYKLKTMFEFESRNKMTVLTVNVDGYGSDEMMQWIRECGEMGWRQSLFHLKTVIELGLDLRNDIFNYPRLGVLNYTATPDQLSMHGLDPATDGGNHIGTVYPGGPAWQAGIRDGALIIQLANQPVPTYRDFVRVLGQFYGKPTVSTEVIYYEHGFLRQTQVNLTYADQFTGMIDPEAISLPEVSEQRKKRTKHLNT